MTYIDMIWSAFMVLCGFQMGWLGGRWNQHEAVADRPLWGRYMEVSERLARAENTIRQLRQLKHRLSHRNAVHDPATPL